MAYDEALAERIRPIIGARSDVTERKMFGALCWMLSGNMAVGIVDGEDLLVRVDDHDFERALAEPHVRRFEMGRQRATRGFVVVGAQAIAEAADLTAWVDTGADYAASLPPKEPKKAAQAAARQASG